MKNLREEDSENFDDIIPPGQTWFSPKEAGEIIGRSDQFVRNSMHSGRILGHAANGVAAKGEEKRVYMRIHKKMLKLYLLETANYTSSMFLESLKDLVSTCTEFQLVVIEKHVRNLLYNRGGRRR